MGSCNVVSVNWCGEKRERMEFRTITENIDEAYVEQDNTVQINLRMLPSGQYNLTSACRGYFARKLASTKTRSIKVLDQLVFPI